VAWTRVAFADAL